MSASSVTLRDALAEGVLSCKQLFSRFLVGFDDSSHTRQTPDLPNHVAWCLGHCALTMHRVAEKLDGHAIPDTDFAAGPGAVERVSTHSALPPSKFATDLIGFGSKPVDDARYYPPFTRCGEIYNRACDRLATAVRNAPPEALLRPVQWGDLTMPAHLLVQRMLFHNGVHNGQIADLRRALGMKPVLV